MALQQINSTDIATGGALGSIGANNITATYLQTGAVETALTNNGTSFGMKNRIINGDMRIDQRNAGASFTVNNAAPYSLDRWWSVGDATGIFTVQQVTDVPAGFVNSLKVTVTTAATTVGSNSAYRAFIAQSIEGYNVADLGFGAIGASNVTVSFWVKSSITGILPVSLENYDGTRGYPTSYTINQANTWEYKTITVPGDVTNPSTWNKTNSGGLRLMFALGQGSNRVGTANTWQTPAGGAAAQTVAGAQNIINTLNATLQLTGVQVEKGSVATPFEFRDYVRELQMCQRYYYQQSSPGGYFPFGFGYEVSTTVTHIGIQFPVTMRAGPTFNASAASTFYVQDATSNRQASAIALQTSSVACASVSLTIAGGTAGVGAKMLDSGSAAYIGFSSEL